MSEGLCKLLFKDKIAAFTKFRFFDKIYTSEGLKNREYYQKVCTLYRDLIYLYIYEGIMKF